LAGKLETPDEAWAAGMASEVKLNRIEEASTKEPKWFEERNEKNVKRGE